MSINEKAEYTASVLNDWFGPGYSFTAECIIEKCASADELDWWVHQLVKNKR